MSKTTGTRAARTFIKSAVMLSASVSVLGNAVAQDADDVVDEIVVTGIRGSIQETLEVKRNTAVVSDGLIGVELGDLPDLSIAESLERITGVTGDRFQGGAAGVSIRGLGEFLAYATLNGREVTSGSDGRGVNFGQFPSELFEGVQVFKSQQAELIEGGTAGTITLNTLRPLDYNRRRFQVNGLLGYSDLEDRVANGDPINERLTVSYVDQFEAGALGEIGIALGGQIRRDTTPEEIYTTSSTFRPCNSVGGNNCSFDPDDADTATYFTSNQYIFRATDSQKADRDSIMANVQWRPTNRFDINADFQWSDRDNDEERGNLVFADGRRGITPIEVSEASGALLAWQGNTRIENQSVDRFRAEQYIGGGLEIDFEASDQLNFTLDVGYSDTERRQDEFDLRIRTQDRVDYQIDTRGEEIPTFTFLDVSAVENRTDLAFDLNNHDIYTNGARARRRLENVDDESIAVRFDGEYLFESDFISSIKAGVRWGERQRVRDDGIDTTVSLVDGYDGEGAVAARRDFFPIDDFYADSGSATRGLTFATWDPQALFVAVTGSIDAGLPTGSTLDAQDTDVTEETLAGYIQANLASAVGNIPFTGNIGVRVVQTDVTSVGVGGDFVTQVDPSDPENIILLPAPGIAINVQENDFVNILPSANVSFELAPDQLLRLAAYRALSRPGIEDMSAALQVNIDDDSTIEELGDVVTAVGNPLLEPLTSWNADISYEWYADEDTAISLAGYVKLLETGREVGVTPTTLTVNGQESVVNVNRLVNSDETSELFGAELSVQHVFSDLPVPLNGFGVRGGINWAENNFQSPDPVTVSGNALADFTKPLGIPGFSRFSGNLTVFWENDDVTLRVAYRGRSGFNRPFRTQSNRTNLGQEFLDFSASYDLTDAIELRVQGLNILNEPTVFARPVKDSLAQTSFDGRRFFVGARAKF